jgi:endoglucanase
MPRTIVAPRSAVVAAIAAAALLAVAAGSGARAAVFTPVDPHAQVRAMGRGVNILGYDPFWAPHGHARFQARHFGIIRRGGFATVRVNLQAFSHMDAEGRLDPRWLAKLDWVVREATRNHLNVILDEHDHEACSDDPQACRPKLLAFWRQVAARYRQAPGSVMFELLNEPHGKLDPQWNGLLRESLAVVRASNPTRNVVVGPADANDPDRLDDLRLPADDRHLIVTFHYYKPLAFTHQGAPWNPATPLTGIGWGSGADRARLQADFGKVQAWAQANDRPILLGEFGAYEKAPQDSRVAYIAAVARDAEARGFAWTYWQFDHDFVVWDMDADRWVEPIHAALVPGR